MVINIVSESFRMGAFFVISELLAGFALQRRPDARQWLRERIAQIGIPTLFGLALICPVTGAIFLLGENRHHATEAIRPNIYHLWSLVALLVYTPLAYGVHRWEVRSQLFARIERRAGCERWLQAQLPLAIRVLSLLFAVLSVEIVDHLVPGDWHTLTAQLRVAAGCTPLFLLGFAAARAPMLRNRLIAGRALPVAILVMATAGYLA